MKKVVKQKVMILQHDSVRKSLHWHVIANILLNNKVGIFPLSSAVIPFISCFTTCYRLDPYFILKLIVCSVFYTCMTVLLG